MLNQCVSDGVLNVSQIASGYDFDGADVLVLFERLSDGRIDVVQADSYGLPTVSVTFTDFVPAPGHTYRITVTGRAADGSLTSLKVNAFYYDTTTEDYAINTQVSYDDITVQFRRTVMGGDPMTSSEQWITPA